MANDLAGGSSAAFDSLLLGCVKSGNAKKASFFIDQGANVNCRDADSRTPLHLAALIGNVELATVLIKNSAEVDVEDKSGSTALHYSALYGYRDILSLLLTSGAEVDFLDLEYVTPLHKAAENGSSECAYILLESGASAKSRDKEGATPLHYACSNGHVDCAEELVKFDAPAFIADSAGNTPLHDAAAGDHWECMKLLLNGSTVDVNARCKDGFTALDIAVRNHHENCRKLLREVGAKSSKELAKMDPVEEDRSDSDRGNIDECENEYEDVTAPPSSSDGDSEGRPRRPGKDSGRPRKKQEEASEGTRKKPNGDVRNGKKPSPPRVARPPNGSPPSNTKEDSGKAAAERPPIVPNGRSGREVVQGGAARKKREPTPPSTAPPESISSVETKSRGKPKRERRDPTPPSSTPPPTAAVKGAPYSNGKKAPEPLLNSDSTRNVPVPTHPDTGLDSIRSPPHQIHSQSSAASVTSMVTDESELDGSEMEFSDQKGMRIKEPSTYQSWHDEIEASRLRVENQHLKMEMEALRKIAEANSEQYTAAEVKGTRISRELEQLKSQDEKWKQVCANLKEDMKVQEDKWKHQLDRAHKELSTCREHIHDLKQEVAASGRSLEDVGKECEVWRSEYYDALKLIEEKDHELKKLRKEYAENHVELVDGAAMEELERKLSSTQNELEVSRADLQREKESREAIETQRKALTMDNQVLTSTIEKWKRVSKLNTELEDNLREEAQARVMADAGLRVEMEKTRSLENNLKLEKQRLENVCAELAELRLQMETHTARVKESESNAPPGSPGSTSSDAAGDGSLREFRNTMDKMGRLEKELQGYKNRCETESRMRVGLESRMKKMTEQWEESNRRLHSVSSEKEALRAELMMYKKEAEIEVLDAQRKVALQSLEVNAQVGTQVSKWMAKFVEASERSSPAKSTASSPAKMEGMGKEGRGAPTNLGPIFDAAATGARSSDVQQLGVSNASGVAATSASHIPNEDLMEPHALHPSPSKTKAELVAEKAATSSKTAGGDGEADKDGPEDSEASPRDQPETTPNKRKKKKKNKN